MREAIVDVAKLHALTLQHQHLQQMIHQAAQSCVRDNNEICRLNAEIDRIEQQLRELRAQD